MNTKEFFEIPKDILLHSYIARGIVETFGIKNERRMHEWINRQRRSRRPAINSRVWDWLNDEIQEPYVNILRNYADPIPVDSAFWKEFTHTPLVYAVIEALMASDATTLYPCARFDPECESLGTNPSHILACSNEVVSFVTTQQKGNHEAAARIEGVYPWTIVNALLSTWQRGGPRADTARAFLCKCGALALQKTVNRRTKEFSALVAVNADGSRAFQAQMVVAWQIKDGTIEYVSYPQKSFRERKVLLTDVPHQELGIKSNDFWKNGTGLAEALEHLNWHIIRDPGYQFCFIRKYEGVDLNTEGLLVTPAEYMPQDIGEGELILRYPNHRTA